jgi:CRISPR-associated endonuclease/helicase Cas3
MIFYAKPDQTYEDHLEAVYTAWKETVSAKRPLIERVAKRYNFSVERFLKGSLLTAAFHDIGKMIEPFQEMMQAEIHNKPFDKSKNYRHELVSFIFAAKYWVAINKKDYLSTIPLEALAVVSHHKSLNSDLTSFNRESVRNAPPTFPDGINEAIVIAEKLFKREGYVLPSLEQINNCKDPFKSLSNLIASGILSKGIEKDGGEKCRVIYSLIKGILHYADWYGSGKNSVTYSVNKDISLVIDELKERCNRKGIIFTGLRPFQETCGRQSGHLIAIAPTGSGKTEASILWALKNTKEMKSAKILYFLPTMVTANNTYERLSDFFGKENVGLTHSTANLFLQNDSSLEAEEDKWENRRDVLFNQSFIKPVTVGTIDQLLTAGFNAGRWTLKETNASNSVIIIDEIHAYDGWTMGLIISAIRHFSSLGAQFMLMSATLPQSLQQLFYSELKNAAVVKEDTLLNAKRSKYFIIDDFINNAIKDIEKAILDDKRALVVVNTVKLCQDLAQKLSHLNPVCYHSQFILKDRKAIEKKITDAHFVIATQVIEVSLDIDYDWLFTECAPPDAVAQRAGRVNRYRYPQRDSRVYIFKASGNAEKIYNQINLPNFLERSFEEFFKEVTRKEKLSENDLINIVETVYKDYRIEGSEAFKEAVLQYKLSQSNRNMIFDSRLREDKQEVTRQTKYETVSVIPKCFRDEVLSLKPSERQWFEVKIPAWYARRYKEEIGGITFCDVDYDPNIGVIFTKDREVSSMII